MEKQLPNNWMETTIGELYSFTGGGTPSKSIKSYWEGSIPWASVKDISNVEELNFTKDFISKEGFQNSASNLAEAGDVIIGTRMLPGKPVISNIQVAVNQDLKIVKSSLDSRFTYYWFKALIPEFDRISGGTTVKGIRIENLKQVKFPLPPKKEQIRIVKKLDLLFKNIKNLKNRISNLDPVLGLNLESLKPRTSQLENAILNKAFKGELVEQLPTDGDAKDLLKEIDALKATVKPKAKRKLKTV